MSNEASIKAFKNAMDWNGYRDRGWTPYWLRHTFITYGQEVLGQEDIKLLAGDYHHIAGYDHTDEETLYKKGLGAKRKLDSTQEKKPKTNGSIATATDGNYKSVNTVGFFDLTSLTFLLAA